MIQIDLNQIDWTQKSIDNLSKKDRTALRKLQDAKEVVIKRSDKGGNVVLMSEEMYDGDIRHLLGDGDTYKQLENNPFPAIVQVLNEKIKFAKEVGLLSKCEYEYLWIDEYNIPTFYIIPKVHKNLKNPPGRPIVSAIKGPLDRIGRYLDSLLKDMVKECR